MCLSTPATAASVVSLGHSSRLGSHSCTTTVFIQVECGCVLTTSKTFVRGPWGSGSSWTVNELIPQQACALHVELFPHHMKGLSLALHGSTHVDKSRQNSLQSSASSAPLPFKQTGL
jgi:hypothetical protein